jgi:hypothetical protein
MRTLRSTWASVFHGEIAVWPALVAGAIVAVASFLIGPNRGEIEVDAALASVATFLFGVLLAFTIVRTRERLALVQNLVAKSNASLSSIHQMMAVFGPDDRRQVRTLIDDHLTDQIDYRLVDHHAASPSFERLTSAMYALSPGTRQEEVVYKELIRLGVKMSEDRVLSRRRPARPCRPSSGVGSFFCSSCSSR